jgi:hypothetical protein
LYSNKDLPEALPHRTRLGDTGQTGRGSTAETLSHTSRPTIRVNIGRIEVRAVTPEESPSPYHAPVKRLPKLTLDEYIKRRKRGGTG